jgi:hypothetical protein
MNFLRIKRNIKLIEALRKYSNDDYIIKKELYNFLDILEDKTSSLLIFNSITIVVIMNLISSKTIFIPVIAYIAMIFMMLSSIISFTISRMSWGFLQKAGAIMDEEHNSLCHIVDKRTIRYMWAWRLSITSVVFTIGIVIYKLFIVLKVIC